MASINTVEKTLRNLAVIFGDPGMLEEKVGLYYEAFKEADDEILLQASRLYILQGRKFPLPADLIDFYQPVKRGDTHD